MSHATTKAPSTGDKGHARRYCAPREPSSLNQRPKSVDYAFDERLAEALRIGREQLGEGHPLMREVLATLRSNEKHRGAAPVDALSRQTGWKIASDHHRHQQIAPLLEELLGEPPINEATLPGLPGRRVDMFFPDHRLVVEENQPRHRCSPWRERDAEVRAHCEATGLAYLEVWTREPLTPEHLSARLAEVGIAA